jgi:hypothetical protein
MNNYHHKYTYQNTFPLHPLQDPCMVGYGVLYMQKVGEGVGPGVFQVFEPEY